jgi:hypothetical protein
MTDKSGFPEAIAAASDVVIMVLGEHGLQSGGRSRSDLGFAWYNRNCWKQFSNQPNVFWS